MRQLNDLELALVSGGDYSDIVVTGHGGGGSSFDFGFWGFGGYGGFDWGGYDSGSGGGGGGGYDASTADSDGDGTPDSEDTAPNDPNEGGTIVVTGHVPEYSWLGGDVYAQLYSDGRAEVFYYQGGFLGLFGHYDRLGLFTYTVDPQSPSQTTTNTVNTTPPGINDALTTNSGTSGIRIGERVYDER